MAIDPDVELLISALSMSIGDLLTRVSSLESKIGTIDIPIPETITIETFPGSAKVVYRKE